MMKKIFIHSLLLILLSNLTYSKDFWERINVPNDSYVRDIALFNNGKIMSCGLGMYLTTDNGTNWKDISILNYEGHHFYLSAFPVQFNSIFAVNDTLYFGSFVDGFIVKSVNSGESWEMMDENLQNIHSFIQAGNGRIFANRAYNLYYTDDLGKNWTKYANWPESNTGSFNKVSMALSPDGKIFVPNKGVWVIDPETLEGNKYIQGIDTSLIRCFAFGNGKVYSGTDTSGIYVSSDNCLTWSSFINSPHNVRIISLAVTQSGKILAGSIDGGLYSSTDEGETWQLSDIINSKLKVYSIKIKENKIYIASAGIFTSNDDGDSWSKLSSNPGYPLVGVLENHNNGIITLVTDNNVFRSVDNMNSWNSVELDFNLKNSKRFCFTNDGKVLLSTFDDRFLISDANLNNFTDVDLGVELKWVNQIKKDKNGYIYVNSFDKNYINTLYVSKDNGITWDLMNTSNNFTFFYVGTNNEIIIIDEEKNIAISEDLGLNWKSMICPLLTDIYTDNLECFEKTGDYIYIGTYRDGIIKSSDNGNTWAFNNSGLISDLHNNNQIRIRGFNEIFGKMYVSTDIGLFSSYSADTTWTLEESGIMTAHTIFTKYMNDKHIYVSSATGLYRSTDEIVTVDENIEIEGINISVQPNPVVNSGTIYIECKDNSDLKLNLYDLSGNLIENIFDNAIPEGKTTLEFNPVKLSSGQYYLRAETASSSKTKIISIIK